MVAQHFTAFFIGSWESMGGRHLVRTHLIQAPAQDRVSQVSFNAFLLQIIPRDSTVLMCPFHRYGSGGKVSLVLFKCRTSTLTLAWPVPCTPPLSWCQDHRAALSFPHKEKSLL